MNRALSIVCKEVEMNSILLTLTKAYILGRNS